MDWAASFSASRIEVSFYDLLKSRLAKAKTVV